MQNVFSSEALCVARKVSLVERPYRCTFTSLNSKRGPGMRRVANQRSGSKRWIISTENRNRAN